jgi:hypothetical protein
MLRTLLFGDWGSLTVAGRRLPVWLIVTLVGMVVWLGSILVATGADALVAAWTALALLVPILLLATATRTVSLRMVGVFFLLGGAMIGVALLWVMVFEVVLPAHDRVRATVQPIVEELLKLAPLLVFLWLRRRDRTWSLGATDVLLLGAATGIAFGFVEDAYIRHNPLSLLWQGPAWLPAAETPDYGARLIVGHGVWTTVAAGGIGLALTLRARRPLAIAVAIIAVLLPILDHITNNTISLLGRNATDDVLVNFVQLITANGWALAYLMVVVVVLVVAVDLFILLRTWPGPFARLRPTVTPLPLPDRWYLVRFGRSLAFIRRQFTQALGGPASAPADLSEMDAGIRRAFAPSPSSSDPTRAAPDAAAPLAEEGRP